MTIDEIKEAIFGMKKHPGEWEVSLSNILAKNRLAKYRVVIPRDSAILPSVVERIVKDARTLVNVDWSNVIVASEPYTLEFFGMQFGNYMGVDTILSDVLEALSSVPLRHELGCIESLMITDEKCRTIVNINVPIMLQTSSMEKVRALLNTETINYGDCHVLDISKTQVDTPVLQQAGSYKLYIQIDTADSGLRVERLLQRLTAFDRSLPVIAMVGNVRYKITDLVTMGGSTDEVQLICEKEEFDD